MQPGCALFFATLVFLGFLFEEKTLDSVGDKTWEFTLSAASETERFAFVLTTCIDSRAFITLQGPLGAGKTTFTKGVGRSLGIEEVVNSPTFTMLNEYDSGRIPLYHFDLYRFLDESAPGSSVGGRSAVSLEMLCNEMDELTSGNGLVIIEWPQSLHDYIDMQDRIEIKLNYLSLPLGNKEGVGDNSETLRSIAIRPCGVLSSQIVDKFSNIYFS